MKLYAFPITYHNGKYTRVPGMNYMFKVDGRMSYYNQLSATRAKYHAANVPEHIVGFIISTIADAPFEVATFHKLEG